MTYSYLVFPDVLLDCLDDENKNNKTKISRLFLSQLLKEKIRVCTLESKRFRGFIADYHWKCFLEIILELLRGNGINEDEINVKFLGVVRKEKY